ncbi:hypothetical protein SprV_0702261000 [Sparganum proliferum]
MRSPGETDARFELPRPATARRSHSNLHCALGFDEFIELARTDLSVVISSNCREAGSFRRPTERLLSRGHRDMERTP